MTKITIGIDEEIWTKLCQLKIDEKLRTFDDVLNYLLSEDKIVKKGVKKK